MSVTGKPEVQCSLTARSCATRDIIFGWVIDMVYLTITLPSHPVERLLATYSEAHSGRQEVTPAPGQARQHGARHPGAKYLFRILQVGQRHQTDKRVRLSPAVDAFLDDFRWLAQDLTSRPTRLAEILPQDPSVIGAVDVAGAVIGSVRYERSKLNWSKRLESRPSRISSSANF